MGERRYTAAMLDEVRKHVWTIGKSTDKLWRARCACGWTGWRPRKSRRDAEAEFGDHMKLVHARLFTIGVLP